MMTMKLNNFDQNMNTINGIYRKLKFAHKSELNGIAEEFDKWFNGEFKNSVSRQCSFNGDRFAMTPPEIVDGLVAESVAKCREIIYPAILSYMSAHFVQFYRDGLLMAKANADMENNTVDLKLSEDDKGSIKLMYSTESKVWQSHIEKHRRQLDRELTGAIQASSKLSSFMSVMTAPDSHIVAYPYGNSRISWSEHIRRFLAGRPRMVATTAHIRRLGV